MAAADLRVRELPSWEQAALLELVRVSRQRPHGVRRLVVLRPQELPREQAQAARIWGRVQFSRRPQMRAAGFMTRGSTSSSTMAPRTGSSRLPKFGQARTRCMRAADGVLGDFAQANITVVPGKTIDLGKLVWKPVRYGTQVWEIGYPDRAADEFFKGDGQNYWLWGWNLRYALLFPNGLTYTVGKSDPHKDWFFEEVPTRRTCRS